MAGSNIYDQIINGSFGQLNPGVGEMYAGIYPPASPAQTYQPGMTGRGLPLNASSRLPSGSAGIDPIGWTPPAGPAWNTETPIDTAAINQWNNGMAPGASTDAMMAMFPNAPTNPAVGAATNLATLLRPTLGGGMRPGGSNPPPTRQGFQGLLSLLTNGSGGGFPGLLSLFNHPQSNEVHRTGMPAGSSSSGGKGITAPGGGGAFIAPAGTPAASAGAGPGSLLPASMNNERWLTGY